MSNHAVTCTLVAGLSLALSLPAHADPFPGASGMAPLDNSHYLCVQDRKADKPGACIGVLEVDASGQRALLDYTPLRLSNWTGLRANDLEAVCPLAGSPGDFLACESGYFGGQFGRLVVLHASRGKHGWQVRRTRTLLLPALGDQIEGIATADYAERVLLILGTRGGAEDGASGALHYGWLDELRAAQSHLDGPPVWPHQSLELPNPFDAPGMARGRAVSDLYLAGDGTLYVASAFDPDVDSGPFASCVQALALVDPESGNPVLLQQGDYPRWLLEGIKIEALAAPCLEGGLLSFATDDEDLGGIWRQLGEPTDLIPSASRAADGSTGEAEGEETWSEG